MAGNTPATAVTNFLDPIQKAVACVTTDVIRPSGYKMGQVYVLTFPTGPATLKGVKIKLRLTHHFEVVEAKEDVDRGPFKVSSLGYDYAIEDGTGGEVLAYHWHPNQSSDITAPHLHLEPGAQVGNADVAKAHLPTGRVSIEDAIELVVRDFHAKPLKQKWAKILSESRQAYEIWRTWPTHAPTKLSK
jgi:hypothetical protein